MPLYEVEHTIHLSPLQLDKLAEGITRIHTLAFTTPSLFVNVRFTNVAQQVTYVGGKPKRANRIIAHVRNGGGRSNAQFEKICKELTEEWDKVIQHDAPEYKLRAVFILGTITTAMEAGFVLPQAGDDIIWMKAHRNEFRKRAGEKESEGDPEFKELMREMQERDDLKKEFGDQAGAPTQPKVPEHSREPQAGASQEGHTPDQFVKISKRDGETPTAGVSESTQQDTTTKHGDAHREGHQGRDVSQQRDIPQQGVPSQPGAVSQPGQSLPQADQPLQEGEILQDHPYLKYYIHDLDTPAESASPPLGTMPIGQAPGVPHSQLGSQATAGTPLASDRPSEQRGSQLGQQSSQSDQGAQYAQGSQYSGDRQSGLSASQLGGQAAGSEREGGLSDQQARRTEHGAEMGDTSQDRTAGRQSGAAETAQAQAMFANLNGPSDRGTPGPFTGA